MKSNFPGMRKAVSRAFLATSALTAIIATPAFAAEGDSEETTTGRDIVVTAQFREQSLQDTPLAITAISGAMLEARSLEDVSDIAAQAPNVTLEEGVGQRGGGLIAYIRGIGQYNGAPHYEPGVGTYIDDVYMATMQGALFNLVDIDRVEILRGPQGTLAGKNSVGGAIKLFSRKPTGDGTGYAQLTYGRFDRIEGKAAADIGLADDLFMRVNIAARSGGGYVDRIDYACAHPNSGLPVTTNNDSCRLGTQGGSSYVGGRVALRWIANDQIEINLTGDYTDDSSEPAAEQIRITNTGALAFAANPATQVNGVALDSRFATDGTYISYSTYCNPNASGGAYCFAPRAATDTWGVAGTVDIELSDTLSLKSITAWRGFASDIVTDGDASPLVITNTNIGYHGHQFSQELRLNSQITEQLGLTLGAYYLDSFINGDNRVDIQYFGLGFFNDDDVKSNSKAAYAQLAFDATDRLHLTGGLRYTDEKKEYIFFRTSTDGSNTPDPVLYNTHYAPYKGSNWDYRLNASFDVSDDVMVYAQYATGFKGGGLNGQPFFADQVYAFGPETINTWEGGIKSRIAGGLATFNLAGFYSDYSDIQLQAQLCPPPSTAFPCAGAVNVGSAHLKGVEAELFAQPVDGLTIDGSLSYLDFNYYKLSNTNVQMGMIAPFTPKFSWSLGAQYKVNMPQGGTLTPRIDFSHRSKIYTDPTNAATNLVPGRTLMNGRLTWNNEQGDVEVALEVTNLTNKYYLANLIDNTAFTGLAYTYPAAPRRWAVSVKKDF